MQLLFSLPEPVNAWTPQKAKHTKPGRNNGPTFTNIRTAKNRKRQHPQRIQDDWPFDVYEIIYKPTRIQNQIPKAKEVGRIEEFRIKLGERISKLSTAAKDKLHDLFQNISSFISSLKRPNNADQRNSKMKDIILGKERKETLRRLV